MKDKLKVIFNYLLIVAMGLVLAINYTLFIVPNGFAPAGINGIAVMVQYKLNFSIGYMSLLINIPLCIIAFIFINHRFSMRSLVFCLSYSLFYLVLQNTDVISAFRYDAGGIDTVYPVAIAGLLSGFVYGMLYGVEACTGGTDIISRLVTRKHPALNFFWVTFSLNAVVAFSSMFVYASAGDGGSTIYNLKPVCLCMLYCFISSYVGSILVKGSKSACEFVLVTENPEELEKEILSVLHHSATRIEGTGIYSGKKKTVLLCVVNKHQIPEFESIIMKYPNVFSVEKTVNSTIGNFKHIAHKKGLF